MADNKDRNDNGTNRRNTREPTGIFQHRDISVARNQVSFRRIHQSVAADRSFLDVRPREVTFVDDAGTELPSGSRISLTGAEATLPMAFDNNRFFDSDDGYEDLLNEASRQMEEWGRVGDAWGEPRREMGFWGWLWRWVVRVAMWLTNDAVNRLRFTRGVQDNLPYQASYESFCLGGIVRAYDVDDRHHDAFNLNLCLDNRNASRVVVQNLNSRWDWLWHTYTMVTHSRFFDFVSQWPFIGGWAAFVPTENFPSSRNLALAALVRTVGTGSFVTRFITGKTEGVVTYDAHTTAQNLAAEANGFELSNRNQYGAHIGREKTNQFRIEHRLTIDESIVRTFVASPASTMINNGVEHVLLCLAKHWRNMLYQDNGNFAHQRMEQLNPFETLRFHMPSVLVTMSNLRGRNVWDMKVLGPFIKRLQHLNPDKIKRRENSKDVETAAEEFAAEIHGPCQAAKQLIVELKDNILDNVCGGVPSRTEPFGRWLDAMSDSLDELSREAEEVKEFVASVDVGIKLGYQLLKLVDWRVPTEQTMKQAIRAFILNMTDTSGAQLSREIINTALHKLPPKDERTLKELVKQDLVKVEAARLLLSRTCTLLEREIRRAALDARIRELSKGSQTTSDTLEKNRWYWIENEGSSRVYVFKGSTDQNRIKVVDVETNDARLFQGGPTLLVRHYIPLAEAISRAQKVFMIIEIDHGKKFTYNAFMEFGSTMSSNSLRTRLRRLVTLSQVHCSTLDLARSNILNEIKTSVQQIRKSSKFLASRLVPECKPQNATVLGGGPTGLLGAIHCLHNVILSGGEVKIYEARDAFDQDAAAFERAQIVRLDSRQISMIRYHLGTGYEDVYVPAKGETDPHHGNVLPTQGFVEVTIKKLESMILDEVINLRSKDLIHFFSDSRIEYDAIAGTFEKVGKSLKVGDLIFEKDSTEIMEVDCFVYPNRLTTRELVAQKDYDIVLPRDKKVRSFRLVQMDHASDFYQFSAMGVKDIAGSFSSLPPLYASGHGRIDPSGIMVKVNKTVRELPFDANKEKRFRLDFSASHVIVGTGKPPGSPSHFYTTTEEPYAVCCIEGIKISMGMHNFGEKRWGSGLVDDFRSHSDQNTRIVGDFTKSVVLVPIVERMRQKLEADQVWKVHFDQLPESYGDRVSSLHSLIRTEIDSLCSTSFVRERLQTRFFELGNNYYLGMELPREFDYWKKMVVPKVIPSLPDHALDAARQTRKTLQRILPTQIDRLWYEATLEIIAEGDVYNPGGRASIPPLYTIDSPFEQSLGEMNERDAFRMFPKTYRVDKHSGDGFTEVKGDFDRDTFPIPTKTYVIEQTTKAKRSLDELAAGDMFEPIDTFEIIAKRSGSTIVRNSGGYVFSMSNKIRVGRSSDLARAPNGYAESKVALAAFPVAHIVSHRTLRVNRVSGKDGEDGYITSYVGDAQASPHFMRYSGLTGACINCMSFNNLVAQALQGVPFEARIQRYAFETNWSNGEVVQRGTGTNYGENGFLRPGWPHRKLVDYLYGRVLEHFEIGDGIFDVVTRDWKVKLAAGIIPRGLEVDGLFIEALENEFNLALRAKFEDEVKFTLGIRDLPADLIAAIANEMDHITKANRFDGHLDQNRVESKSFPVVQTTGQLISGVLRALNLVIDYAAEMRSTNTRLSSEAFNQPKPVDSIVDDFAVESQNFANALAESAAFTSATIALSLSPGKVENIISALLGLWNISISFNTITNVCRYRNRNEEARRKICDEKMAGVKKAVFSLLTRSQRDSFTHDENPFYKSLDALAALFIKKARYYNTAEDTIATFENSYRRMKGSMRDESKTVTFIRELLQVFIPKTFHVNSYLQEHLVNIYKALDEMLTLAKQSPANGTEGALELYRDILKFEPVLQASIERGNINFGFAREHEHWYQNPLPVTIRFALSPLFGTSHVTHQSRAILKRAEAMKATDGTLHTLSRPVVDLTQLYHGTKESEVASIVIFSSSIVFFFSIFFSLFRLIEYALESDPVWLRRVLEFLPWLAQISILGSLLAINHFVRKLRHLFRLGSAMKVMRSDVRIQHIISVTKTQQLLVFIRLLVGIAATIALPWSLVVMQFGPIFLESNDYPIYVALFATLAALFAVLLFFVVEYRVRYNFDPCLGRAVCEPLRERIEQIKASFTSPDATSPNVSIETTQALERDAWEYATRQFLHEYRFDTVFAADRFGTVFQHLQSGNKQLN